MALTNAKKKPFRTTLYRENEFFASGRIFRQKWPINQPLQRAIRHQYPHHPIPIRTVEPASLLAEPGPQILLGLWQVVEEQRQGRDE